MLGFSHSTQKRRHVNMEPITTRKQDMNSDFNKQFFDTSNTNGLTAYTFIYRFQKEQDFTWTDHGKYSHPSVILQHGADEHLKYVLKILCQLPSLCIYHERSFTNSKNCQDAPHFHIVIWARQHPTSNYAFGKLKEYLKSERAQRQYDMTCPTIFKPDGLIDYFKKGEVNRQLLCTNDLTTPSQKMFMERLTNGEFAVTTTGRTLQNKRSK